jgi:hypothetical protein
MQPSSGGGRRVVCVERREAINVVRPHGHKSGQGWTALRERLPFRVVPIEVGIWRIDNGDVRRVNAAALEAERRLEDVLVRDITILGLGPLLILDR